MQGSRSIIRLLLIKTEVMSFHVILDLYSSFFSKYPLSIRDMICNKNIQEH